MVEENKSPENDQSDMLILEGKEITEEELKAYLEMTVNAQNKEILNVFRSTQTIGKCKKGEFTAPKTIVDGKGIMQANFYQQ